jgi:hypothetical protein
MGQIGQRVHYWSASYYPGAGELTAWEDVAGEGSASAREPIASVGDRLAAIFGEGAARGAGSARDPEPREDATRQRSGRRARSRLRRYAAANHLDRLIVLTYAEQTDDLAKVKRDVRLFVKRKLRPLVGPDMPYAITWELHKSGTWHVNILLNSYVRHAKLHRAWGRGFVWITKFKSKSGGKDAAREAARYASKYAGKDVEGMDGGIHRYEVAQGFAPAVVRLYGGSLADVVDEAGEAEEPRYVWRSIGAEDWRGPPVAFVSW